MLKEITLNEISNFLYGQVEDKKGMTGCTVVLCPTGAMASVSVRGGGPASHETELLKPENTIQKIHSVVLSGGSAYGLEATSGVMKYLEERNIGFKIHTSEYCQLNGAIGAALFAYQKCAQAAK